MFGHVEWLFKIIQVDTKFQTKRIWSQSSAQSPCTLPGAHLCTPLAAHQVLSSALGFCLHCLYGTEQPYNTCQFLLGFLGTFKISYLSWLLNLSTINIWEQSFFPTGDCAEHHSTVISISHPCPPPVGTTKLPLEIARCSLQEQKWSLHENQWSKLPTVIILSHNT